VDGSTLRPGVPATRRLEGFRSGARFRYGGPYPIPMEEGEQFDFAEFDSFGERARVLHAKSAKCSDCPLDTVRLVVIVDRKGKVTQFGPRLGSRDLEPDLLAAIEKVLTSWRFEPAKIRGRPVTDWLELEIPITH